MKNIFSKIKRYRINQKFQMLKLQSSLIPQVPKVQPNLKEKFAKKKIRKEKNTKE